MPSMFPTAAEFERQLLEAEGEYTVEGRYFSSAADARVWRRAAAERMAREARHLAAYVAHRLATIAAAAAEASDPYGESAPRLRRQRNSHVRRSPRHLAAPRSR